MRTALDRLPRLVIAVIVAQVMLLIVGLALLVIPGIYFIRRGVARRFLWHCSSGAA
jgi:hypothetical protein